MTIALNDIIYMIMIYIYDYFYSDYFYGIDAIFEISQVLCEFNWTL